MKWLMFLGIIALVYFCAVGFLRTASRAGWNESGAVQPVKSPLKH